MPRDANELKEAILKKFNDRKDAREEEEPAMPDEGEEEFDIEDFEVDDEDPNDQDCGDVEVMGESELMDAVHQDGFDAFMSGVSDDKNPYLEDEPEIAPVWESGWLEAYGHACITDLILSVDTLLEAEDADAAEKALVRLKMSYDGASSVLPLEECQEFWDALEEG